jgi:putative two-component system response regulator
LQIIRRLGRASEFKDNETGLHVIRMSHYSRLIGIEAGLKDEEVELLLNAAPMHDVGKIGIPDNILLKPGKLNDEEWNVMRRHPKFGMEIIGEHKTDLLREAGIISMTHHEKWNGKGYPKGLAEEEIPLFGRIVAIADVFDALTSVRPYKKAWTVDDAVNLIKEEGGEHFDPKLIPCFEKALPEILKVKDKYAETA